MLWISDNMQNCAKLHILHSLSSISVSLNKIRHTSLGMLKKYNNSTLEDLRLQQQNLQSWLSNSSCLKLEIKQAEFKLVCHRTIFDLIFHHGSCTTCLSTIHWMEPGFSTNDLSVYLCY